MMGVCTHSSLFFCLGRVIRLLRRDRVHSQVTVSTVGLVPEIRQFCQSSNAQLAVSLHATTDEIRDWIAPVNRRWDLSHLMSVLQEFFPAHARTPAAVTQSVEAAAFRAELPPSPGGHVPNATWHSGGSNGSGGGSTGAVIPSSEGTGSGAAAWSAVESSASSVEAVELRTGAVADGVRAPTLGAPAVKPRFGRFVLIEYVMLRGVNDTLDDAYRCTFYAPTESVLCMELRSSQKIDMPFIVSVVGMIGHVMHRLLELLEGIEAKVNLIVFNPHEGTRFKPSHMPDVMDFRSILIQGGRVCTLRDSRGDDEMAACGQLGDPGTTAKPAPILEPPSRLKELLKY